MLEYFAKCAALGFVSGLGLGTALKEAEKPVDQRNNAKLIGGVGVALVGMVTVGVVMANRWDELTK